MHPPTDSARARSYAVLVLLALPVLGSCVAIAANRERARNADARDADVDREFELMLGALARNDWEPAGMSQRGHLEETYDESDDVYFDIPAWTTLSERNQPVRNASLFNWDLSNLENQTISLHLYMKGEDGYAEKTVRFSLALATPTPTLTPTSAPPDTPTPSATAEPPTPTPTPTQIVIILPSDTPTP